MPDAKKLTQLFLKARTDVGLTTDRLKAVDAQELLNISFVQVLAASGISRERAAIELCRQAALQLEFTDQLIVDVILNIDVLSMPHEVTSELRSRTLMPRRKYLADNWTDLHVALEQTPPHAETVDSLRRRREERAFDALSRALGSMRSVTPLTEAEEDRQAPTNSVKSKVIVIGSAVMDIIFTLPKNSGIPEPDSSVQVEKLELHPGGKALTQAVAAARLGMDVWLASRVGDDTFADEIIEYLKKNNVNTALVTKIPGQKTPVTGVIAYQSGTSVALGWKNEGWVRLNPDDITSGPIFGQIQVSDFVFLTFEPPAATVSATIGVVASLRESGNDTIKLLLTPAPPLENERDFPAADGYAVDYLIANKWECEMLAPGIDGNDPIQVLSNLASEILGWGIRAVCIPSDGQCYVFRLGQDPLGVRGFMVPVHDNTGERDALAAALAYQLSLPGKSLDHETLTWAAAAMAASSQRSGVANSMPKPADVQRVIDSDPRS